MLKTLIVIILFITSIAFIFQNQIIFIHIFPINFDMKAFNINNVEVHNSVIMLSAFVLGCLITLILIGDSLVRKSLMYNELKKKIIAIEEKEKYEEGNS